MPRASIILLVIAIASTSVSAWPVKLAAAPFAADPFERTWERTDLPVASGQTGRTWMWGPEPFTEALQEDYAESPGGQRMVQYFDKSRMEITDPTADQNSAWYVTNGLLVVELMTGRLQVGDDEFVQRDPAQVNVAGDAGDPLTYAVLAGRRDDPSLETGAAVTQRLDAQGQVSDDPDLASYGVTAITHVPETGHTVASPFWDFMTSSGPVWEGGQLASGPLFANPYYATGLPITEAYWANVQVGGAARLVLVQCFERRCLTYTPDNPEGWQVEAGNVGQHYERWRYGQAAVEAGPSDLANALAATVIQAGTDAERYDALLQVMNALNVGVYAGNGEMIIGGAERRPEDFYLYDIELRMMAGAMERGQTWGIPDLAMQLTAMGILPEGETLDPALLRQIILTGVSRARETPGDHSSLAALLARQLGLSGPQPYDLFEDIDVHETRFDGLSYFLLLADLAAPLLDGDTSQVPLTSRLLIETNGILQQANTSACDPNAYGFHGDTFKTSWGWAKIFAELGNHIPTPVTNVTAVLDALHGALLAYSVGVSELDDRLETHYGHESPGNALQFRVKVEMRDELPEEVVNCGWLVGTEFPPKGPIAGVSVHWFWPGLGEHGELACGNACGTLGETGLALEATDANGIATLTFTPKQEAHPGEGWIVEDSGVVTGIGLYQSRFTNLIGSYAQYLTPKSGMTRWVVERHEQPGWNVTMNLEYDVHGIWHVQTGDPGYVLDEYARSGSATFRLFIPAQAIDGSIESVTFEGSGNGTFLNNVEDRTKYGAYGDLWAYTCGGTWNGSWQGTARLGAISQRTDGEHYTDIDPRGGVPHELMTITTHVVGSYPNPGPCGPNRYDAGTTSILLTTPEFSLDEAQPQRFDVGNVNTCQYMGELESGFMSWGDKWPMDSCDVDVRWTIEVEFGGLPE